MLGYSTSSLISLPITFLSGFFVARLLGPSEYGTWNAVSLVLTYGAYSELGILSAMGRDLPFYQGKRDQVMINIIEGTARYSTIIGASCVAFFVFIWSFIPGHTSLTALGLRGMSFVLLLQQVYAYHRTMLRSYNHFSELARQQVLYNMIVAVLSIILAMMFGFVGRLFAALLALSVILIYAVHRNPWRAVPKFNASISWSLMRVGVPITISGFLISLVTTVDSLIVITFLDSKQLGYLGPGFMLIGLVYLIPGMACQVLYPRITYCYGNMEKSLEAIRTYVLEPPQILSLFLPHIIGPLYLLLPFVIRIFLPAYEHGIIAAQIIVVGAFFYGVLGLTDYFLVTIGRLKQYMLFGSMALMVNIGLDFLFLHLKYGIEGIAIGGTLLTYFFYSCVMIGYAQFQYTRQPNEWIKYFIRIWTPFLYMIFILKFVEKIVNYLMPINSNKELFFSLITQIFLYLLFCTPMSYVLFRDGKKLLEIKSDRLAKRNIS